MSEPEPEPTPGLRERKRRATRSAIQVAILDLAARHGYDQVTIDEVSAAADISPRTFFNYFSSKDDAVIGDFPALSGLPATAEFLAAGPRESVYAGLGRLLDAASGALAEERMPEERRRALLREHPGLFAKRMAYLHRFEDELTGIIAERLATDDATIAGDAAALQRRSRLLSLIGLAAVRYAYRAWIGAEDGRSLGDNILEAFSELEETLAPTSRS
ncbi:MAG TPA: TetR family transcriptional regulator [Terrimesophilobacter sp.]|nr:TetR family transcriptional regulator [Terrimesophilobacter sp.]